MSIEKTRKEIDSIDGQIVKLLDKRAAKVKSIAAEKSKEHKAVFDPAREAEVLRKISGKSKEFPREGIEAVFSEVLSASRSLQGSMKIAFLGPEASFTHMAAIKKFGQGTEYVPVDSISEIFSAVEKGKASFGVAPIENSTEGTVNHTQDMFLDSQLNIAGEIYLDIHHHLLSNIRPIEIKKIYSHPQAFAQCRKWINKNHPRAELVEVSSTTKGAESATLYHSSAAIASLLAAKKFNLKILAENIEDLTNNTTRFLVIGKAAPKRTGKDKTSIVLSVKHEAGALFKALEAFKKHNVNMTKIESRPTKMKNWEYVFFVDVQGFIEDDNIKKALKDMEQHTGFINILGSYPEGNSKS